MYTTVGPCVTCLAEQPSAKSELGAYCRVRGGVSWGLSVRVTELGDRDPKYAQGSRAVLTTELDAAGDRVFREGPFRRPMAR